MTESNTTELDDESQPETITIEFPLDAAHEEMVKQLRDADIPIEKTLAQQVQPAVESAIHETFQQSKYQRE